MNKPKTRPRARRKALTDYHQKHREMCRFAVENRSIAENPQDLPKPGALLRMDSGVLCRCLLWFGKSTDDRSPSWDRRIALVRIVDSPDTDKIPVGVLGLCPEDECHEVKTN